MASGFASNTTIHMYHPWDDLVFENPLLTEQHQPLTKNSLTLLFVRLSQRAGLTRKPICPSMLRDTYAIRFLQAGGELAILQKQLGVVNRMSVRRYQCFCDRQRRAEAGVQEFSGPATSPRPVR